MFPFFIVDLKTIHENAVMSRSSFPSFHLNDKNKPVPGNSTSQTSKIMTSSVDRLFENEGDVFMSNHFIDFQVLFIAKFGRLSLNAKFLYTTGTTVYS